MNKEDNHIIIEVLNSNGDIKLTKMRNPRALWQKYDYLDEYIFKDVDYVNIFSLIQENEQLQQKVEQLETNIDEAIKLCNYLLKTDSVCINGKVYYKQKDDDVITKRIIEELERGKE